MAKKLTQQDFIERSNQVHNYRYDYSKSIYIANAKKVIIICHLHGEFEQAPNDHFKGSGCPICGRINSSKKQKYSISQFIKKANKVHNNKYNYTKSIYTHSKNKLTIICPEHGEFIQEAHSHLQGIGCPYCKDSKGEKKIRSYLLDNNIEFESQKSFNGFRNNKNKRGGNYRFDFYLPNHNLLIEYDGELHYRASNYFGGKDFLEIIKERDFIKTEYAKYNGIKLLRIPYWKINNIDKILDKNIFNEKRNNGCNI